MNIKKYGFIFFTIVIVNLTGCVTTIHGPTKIGKNIYLVEKEGRTSSPNSSQLLTETLRVAVKYCKDRSEKIKVTSTKKTPIVSRSGNDIKSSIVFSCLNELSKDEVLKNIDFSDVTSLKSLLFSTELDPIEGIWTWLDNSYKVAIIKNKYQAYSDYEYMGIVSTASSSLWEAGEVKLLLNSTTSKDVYIGVYVMPNKVKEGVTFVLIDGKLIEVNVPVGDFRQKSKISIIKNYPKLKSNKLDTPKVLGEISQGSCFFVQGSGTVVTNHHVISNSSNINVIDHFGNSFNAVIEQLDPSNDLAILKVNTKKHHYINISPIGTVRTGLEIFSVGYPVSSILGSNVKYTEGVISSTTGLQDMANMFQMTVPIQPGNSGGPILNMQGEVVGVATSSAGIASFYKITGAFPQNINWAIKSDYLSLLIKGDSEKVDLGTRQEAIDAAINASCIVIVELDK